jgi:anaerobic magnesium-protoporphyrin IX monomethyl ester cyclase
MSGGSSMKILTTRTPLSRMPFLFEDLGLEMVTASLRRAGFECRFLDALQEGFAPDKYIRELVDGPEEILCVTLHAEEQADEIMTMLSSVKKQARDKIIVLGGHPTHAIDEAIFKAYPRAFDYIIRGDGEEAIVELVKHLTAGNPALDTIGGLSYGNRSKFVRLPNRRRNENYGGLPHASRDTWEGNKLQPRTRSALMYLSRGCNHLCQFCSVVTFYGVKQRVWVSRSIDSFIQELSDLRSKYGIRDITVVDPNFLGNPQGGNIHVQDLIRALNSSNLKIIYDIAARVDAFSEPLIEEMYASGLRRVFIGVESGVQTTLNQWRKAVEVKKNLETAKRLAATGIYIDTGFIMLTPVTTVAEIRQNLAFLRRLPYFTPRSLNAILWPIHEAATTTTIDRELLVEDDKRVSLSFRFADTNVESYYVLVNAVKQAFSPSHSRIYWHMWDHMYEDPDVIHRFRATMRDILEVQLEIAENILNAINKAWTFRRLEEATWKWIDQKRNYVTNVTKAFD